MGGKKTGTTKGVSKGVVKGIAKGAPKGKGSKEDDDFLDAAIQQVVKERAAIAADEAKAAAEEAAREVAERQRRRAEDEEAAKRGARPEDKPAVDEMPGLIMPGALAAEPSLLSMLQRSDPTSSVQHEAQYGAPKPDVAKDYSKETTRERELRLREARARLRLANKAREQRRVGAKATAMSNYAPPPVYYGDETADEIATRPQLIQEYVKTYAEWLVAGMKGTHLLENTATCPHQFALLFRFDTTLDPVCRHPKSKLGSQLDVLIVSHERVLYYIWSDYADGLLAAATKKDEYGRPLLDVVMSPFNVVEILPGGKRPTGLGIRLTQLDQLLKLPYLNSESYPQGIPAELVLKKRAWGDDLGTEGGAERLARLMASTGGDDEALDSDSDDDETAAEAAVDPVAVEIRKEVRALGRNRFPLTQTILNAFRPEAEAVDKPDEHKVEAGAGAGEKPGDDTDGTDDTDSDAGEEA